MLADPNQVYGCILKSPQNRYLLVQGKQSGKWSFPKGHPEEDESGMECAHRELMEETGLRVSYLYDRVYCLATGTYYMYSIPFECDAEPSDRDEITQCKWVDVDDMRNMSVNVDVNTFLRRIQRNPNKTVKRCLPQPLRVF